MKLRVVLAWLLVGSLFVDNYYIANNWGFDFRIQYILFVLVIPVYLIGFQTKINQKLLLAGLIVSVFLLVSPLIAGTPIIGSVRQLLLIFTCAFPFYCLFNSFDFDIRQPFRIYLFFCKVISVVAMAQLIFIIVRVKPGYDYSWLGFDMSRLDPDSLRIQAWMAEPSFLAYILIPALFYYLASSFNSGDSNEKFPVRYAVLILAAMLLTRSLISYLSITISLAVIFLSKYSVFRKPIAIVCSVVLIVAFLLAAYQVPSIKMRVDDTLVVLNGQEIESVNLSTFYFFNNLAVTSKSFAHSPLFGAGFGNFYTAYDTYANHNHDDGLTPDGASLLFRLLTETGLFFTLLYLVWIFRTKLKMRSVSHGQELFLWSVNNAVFVLIIMRLVRLPHYTALGFPFFILLFCLTFSQSRSLSND